MRAASSVMALALAACGNGGPSAETIAAERAAVAADAAQRTQAAAVQAAQADRSPVDRSAAMTAPGRVDAAAAAAAEQPIPTRPDAGAPRIVRQMTHQGRIDPECTVTVHYQDGTQRDIVVPLGSCADLDLRLISVAQLNEAGQLDDLPGQARQDILRSHGGYVLYAETEFTASAFPLNAAGIAYQVSLAD